MSSRSAVVVLTLAVIVGEIAATDSTTRKTGNRPGGRTPPPRKRVNEGNVHWTKSEVVNRLLINYVRTEPPMSDKPTEVGIGIYVISVYSINEQTMDFSVSMYLRQSWRDPRLNFAKYKTKHTEIRLGENMWEKIWIPDTFLRNEKGASFHTVTVQNRLLNLKPDGSIWYVTKISATLSCPMTLQKFPMDTQVCPMSFESFGYTMDTMYFSPLPKSFDISDDLQLPQFSLINQTLIDCSQNYTTGSYPCLEIQIFLRREIGYFLIQVYVPSVLIVILSWVSFWINVDASPARVSIGLLTVLTTTTMSSGARATLPRVSYIKAIDVWMIVCLVFVFTSLIEYAVVNVFARKQGRPPSAAAASRKHAARSSLSGTGTAAGQAGLVGKRSAQARMPLQQMDRNRQMTPLLNCFKANVSDNAASNVLQSGQQQQSHPLASQLLPLPQAPTSAAAPAPEAFDGKRRARQVDKFSRKAFPAAFVIFNIIYWAVFTPHLS